MADLNELSVRRRISAEPFSIAGATMRRVGLVSSGKSALFGVLFTFITGSSISGAQSVSGIITEKSTGIPVAGASLVLMDQADHPKAGTRADSAGKYLINAPQAGIYRLAVGGRGLASTQSADFQLTNGSTANVDVALTLSAPTLATVVVKGGKRVVDASTANPGKFDEFLMRRKMGMGTFLTRDQIMAKPVSQTASIFAQIPGLKVRQHGTTWDIRSQSCTPKLDKPGPGGDEMQDDDPAVWPILFIDGVHVRGLAALNDINQSEIEGIEVYQGASELPAIAKGNACAAIFVWLRSGKT
jgi:carboxypeptidase family protein